MIVRLMMVAAIVAATGLAACGKKGPLEPPKLHVTQIR